MKNTREVVKWVIVAGWSCGINEDGNVVITSEGKVPYRYNNQLRCYVNYQACVKPATLRQGLKNGNYIIR